jgi:hypothetical protein
MCECDDSGLMVTLVWPWWLVWLHNVSAVTDLHHSRSVKPAISCADCTFTAFVLSWRARLSSQDWWKKR